MFRKTFALLSVIALGTSMGAANAVQYPFVTDLKVSIEKGAEPIYSVNSNVVYPVLSYFSANFPDGDTGFALQHEEGTPVEYFQEGDRFLIDHTITTSDSVFYGSDTTTVTRPVRVMLDGPINLGHVHFNSGSAKLSVEAKAALWAMATQMRDSGLTSAYLVGMTDRAGSDSANLALSRKRVDAASSYLEDQLVKLGVIGAVITTENMGEYLSVTKNGAVNPYDRKVSVLIYPTIK